MRKAMIWPVVVCLLAMLAAVGCHKSDGGTVSLHNGVLSWQPHNGASYVSYEVDLGGGGETVAGTTYNLTERCRYEGEFTVTVRGIKEDGSRAEIGAMTLQASRLASPVVGLEGSAEKGISFVWAAVDGASGYTYDAHDGNGRRTATAGADGLYRVPVTSPIKQLIRVYAEGGSTDNSLRLTAQTLYQYETAERFDLALLSQYPAVFTSAGAGAEEFRVGSTLTAGYYPNMELTLYAMSASGTALTGNGKWGRRISYSENVWLCEHDVEGFPNSAMKFPAADKPITLRAGLTVDRGGNVVLPLYDFLNGEMLVIADIKYEGKSVLNKAGGTANALPDIPKFDLSTADDYLYVYRSQGSWFNENREKCALNIPVDLPDGKQQVVVSFYTCRADGDMLEGNGMWGRRLSSENVDGGAWVWLNANAIDSSIPAASVPKPTEKRQFAFEAEIKNGILKLYAIDFGPGEVIVIDSVEGKPLPSGNGVHVFSGENLEEVIKVQTTLNDGTRRSDVTLTVTLKVSDTLGRSLSGNGIWGRRLNDAAGQNYWLCETAPSADFPAAKGTLPPAGKTVTFTMKVAEINKVGIFKLSAIDFRAGEVLEIVSVKYDGKEILK